MLNQWVLSCTCFCAERPERYLLSISAIGSSSNSELVLGCLWLLSFSIFKEETD